MRRKFEVDIHPQRRQIVNALIKGEPYSRIVERYGTSKAALSRFVNARLKPAVVKEEIRRDLKDVNDFLREVQDAMINIRKMYAACEEYLQDPVDPDKFYLGPRAEDVEILYVHRDKDGQTEKQKARLHDLLEQAYGDDVILLGAHYKHADPRKLILDTARTLDRQLRTLAELRGMIKDVQINIQNMPVWIQMKQLILDATRDHPEARQRIADALRQHIHSSGPGSTGGV